MEKPRVAKYSAIWIHASPPRTFTSLKKLTMKRRSHSSRTSWSGFSFAGGTFCFSAIAAGDSGSSPVCIHTGSSRTAPHAMCVAERHTGTSRLSTPCGSSERYGICPGRDSSVRMSLPS